MPIKTNLESPPYFDDYDGNNDYYKVLFKPGVPVQVRELNQLQTMLQSQIERFGDNIFKRGTIIDGCGFTFHDNIPYIKIKDSEANTGAPVNVAGYPGLYARNETTNVHAYVIASNTGFETQAPDLNTLYLKYINSGTAGEASFSSNDQIIIYNKEESVYEVGIDNGSTGFSNSDSVLFLSSIAVQNSSSGKTFSNSSGLLSTFSAGQTIIGSTSGAQAVVVEANTTANAEAIVLKIRPVYTDLTANPANTAKWTFASEENITVTSGPTNARLISKIGSGATGSLVTDGAGKLITLTVTSGGQGYYVPPFATIISIGGTPSALSLESRNYFAKVTIATVDSSVGTGYGFSISNGVIYQLGYFSRVANQFTIVEKYSNTPDAKVIGFDTTEIIKNSNQDQSLLDNALGTFNYTAPGADRLELVPTLVVLNKTDADANNDFFSIVEFSEGKPFKQNRVTQYKAIEDELAKRTYEESGDYVLDPFLVSTLSDENFEWVDAGTSNEANNFDIIIDPGKAYISGYRVETMGNYRATLDKSVDTEIALNRSAGVNYENFIRVKNVAGVFLFSTGDVVSLRDTAKTFLATGSNYGIAPTAAGSEIGSARIRSMTYESGIPGSTQAIYRLYLFDISMNTGKNFKDVLSLFYDGATYDGVADVILDKTSLGTSIASLQGTANDILVFPVGEKAVKSVNNISYTYRTINQTALTANAAGKITITVTGNETFPYLGTLNSSEKEDIIVIPLANIAAAAAITGTISVNTTTTNVVGSGTSFTTQFEAGDYIKISANATGGFDHRRITSITNGTFLTIDSNASFTNAVSTATFAFPAFIPVPLSTRTGRVANVDTAQQTMIIDLNQTLSGANDVAVAYNVKVTNATPIAKQAQRNLFVRIDCSNNTGNTSGPWTLGVPDVFRLRKVYKGTTNTFTSATSGIEDVTRNFVIDHNQDENVYNQSYLYIKPGTNQTLAGSDRLLVQFDCFSNNLSNTLFSIGSYTENDTKLLANLTTSVNRLEIPQMITSRGKKVDLIEYFDFRPLSVNTAVLSTTEASATIHPAEPARTAKFGNTRDPVNDQKFPVPDSDITFDAEYYVGRKDLVIIGSNGDFNVIKGKPGLTPVAPKTPSDSLVIELLNITPYPSLPQNLSANTLAFIDTKVINHANLNERKNLYSITKEAQLNPTKYSQTPGFTMRDIKSLQDRVEALEYYSTLSLVEDKVKNEVIPSGANTQVNRFKFGYFIDNFTSLNYADINDPEFNAGYNAERNRLVPANEQINLPFKIYSGEAINQSLYGKTLMLPFESVSVVSQLQATGVPNVGSALPLTYNKGKFYTKIPATFTPKAVVPPIYQTVFSGLNLFGLNALSLPPKPTTPVRTTISQTFQFIVNGLRPSTRFYFFFDGKDNSSKCKPIGGKIGDAIKSDKYGIANFQFFLSTVPSDLVSKELNTRKITESQAVGQTLSTSKTLQMKESSSTGTIVAEGVLPVKVTFTNS